MLIKVLLLLGLAMVILSLTKRGKSQEKNITPSTNNTIPDKTMKRCAQCGIHLPETEALAYQTLHFCCNNHKKSYLEDNSM